MSNGTPKPTLSRAVASGEVTNPLDRDIENLNVAVAAGILLERLRAS